MNTFILLKILKLSGISIAMAATAIGYGATSLVVSDKISSTKQFWYWLLVLTIPTFLVICYLFW